MRIHLFGFILILLLSACSGSRFLKTLDVTEENLQVPMFFQSITFVDAREQVSEKIHISLPPAAKQASINPAFTEDHEVLVRSVITSNLATGGGEPYDLTVEILEASKRYDASRISKTEEVLVKLRLTAAGHNVEVSAETGGQYFFSAMRGDEDRHEEIYQIALRNTTYKAMEILKYYESKSGD